MSQVPVWQKLQERFCGSAPATARGWCDGLCLPVDRRLLGIPDEEHVVTISERAAVMHWCFPSAEEVHVLTKIR